MLKNAKCTIADDSSHPGEIKYHQGKMKYKDLVKNCILDNLLVH